jgi:hypothetical protein
MSSERQLSNRNQALAHWRRALSHGKERPIKQVVFLLI